MEELQGAGVNYGLGMESGNLQNWGGAEGPPEGSGHNGEIQSGGDEGMIAESGGNWFRESESSCRLEKVNKSPQGFQFGRFGLQWASEHEGRWDIEASLHLLGLGSGDFQPDDQKAWCLCLPEGGGPDV